MKQTTSFLTCISLLILTTIIIIGCSSSSNDNKEHFIEGLWEIEKITKIDDSKSETEESNEDENSSQQPGKDESNETEEPNSNDESLNEINYPIEGEHLFMLFDKNKLYIIKYNVNIEEEDEKTDTIKTKTYYYSSEDNTISFEYNEEKTEAVAEINKEQLTIKRFNSGDVREIIAIRESDAPWKDKENGEDEEGDKDKEEDEENDEKNSEDEDGDKDKEDGEENENGEETSCSQYHNQTSPTGSLHNPAFIETEQTWEGVLPDDGDEKNEFHYYTVVTPGEFYKIKILEIITDYDDMFDDPRFKNTTIEITDQYNSGNVLATIDILEDDEMPQYAEIISASECLYISFSSYQAEVEYKFEVTLTE
ncbi:hypothetical protein QA597_03600 [Marinilabiliaceae bacterium ANBcel2]|nr:hypothetical protein [Marinilabiliaceae bacterium ANBcel2]